MKNQEKSKVEVQVFFSENLYNRLVKNIRLENIVHVHKWKSSRENSIKKISINFFMIFLFQFPFVYLLSTDMLFTNSLHEFSQKDQQIFGVFRFLTIQVNTQINYSINDKNVSEIKSNGLIF